METVRLWSRQDERVLDIIEKNGVYMVKKEFVTEKYGNMFDILGEYYNWITFESQKRVSKPEGADYPIWCSVTDEMMLRGTEGAVILALEVPKDRVLFFDTEKWGLAMNNMYVPDSREDQERFNTKLKSRGIDPRYAVLDENMARFYPDLKRDIIESRKKIFNIEKTSYENLQANIWEIRKEYIKDIEKFNG